jgi:hypothetical protein
MSPFLKIHIVLGATGLVSGLAPLLLTKSTKLHTSAWLGWHGEGQLMVWG